ncbi:uncharacterized protein LOC127750252 [Frankliniella occidentalis]|uniref:Odorant receptor n=1 Tax=Frankliniella occidentalis TaxID=133901 RepID=A0A9C6XQB8_FRAOC|nr:uncharacterized protein LOC127750252 [Frankliniella occidentalis]
MERMFDEYQSCREIHSTVDTPNNRHSRFWRVLLSHAKWSFLVSFPFTSLLIGGSYTRSTFVEMSRGARMSLAFVAMIYTLHFMMSHGRPHLDEVFVRFTEIGKRMAPDSIARKRRQLEDTADFINLCLRTGKWWSTANVATIAVPFMFSQEELDLKLAPWPPGKEWVVIGWIVQMCVAYPFAYPTCHFFFMYVILNKIQVVLQDVIADQAAAADTPEKLREVAIVDVKLAHVSANLRSLMQTFTLIMMLMLVVPTVTMLMIILQGYFDLFSVTGAPYVVTFVVLCYQGQGLSDACVRISDELYGGHWQEVLDKGYRSNVKIMQIRRGRPLVLTAGAGVGALNLHVCKETMKSWYQLLQLLLKLF